MDKSPDLAVGNVRYTNSPFILLALAGAIMFGFSTYFAMQAKQMDQWLPSQGTIVSTDGYTTTYQYEVDGTTYSSNVISALNIFDQTFHQPRKLDKADGYTSQTPVIVHYDPNNPQKAVLKTGVPPFYIIFIFVGAGMGAFGLFNFASGGTVATRPNAYGNSFGGWS